MSKRIKKDTDKRVMLARRYCNERGECTSNSMFIEHIGDAKKAFKLYASLERTLYVCLFSPVDKRGSRTQLRHYMYNRAKLYAAYERIAQIYAGAAERAARKFRLG